MPEIQIFKFKNNQLRSMIDAHGEPWFVAKDACDILAVEPIIFGVILTLTKSLRQPTSPIGRLGRMAVVLP